MFSWLSSIHCGCWETPWHSDFCFLYMKIDLSLLLSISLEARRTLSPPLCSEPPQCSALLDIWFPALFLALSAFQSGKLCSSVLIIFFLWKNFIFDDPYSFLSETLLFRYSFWNFFFSFSSLFSSTLSERVSPCLFPNPVLSYLFMLSYANF